MMMLILLNATRFTEDNPRPFWVDGQTLPVASIILMLSLIGGVILVWRSIVWYRRLVRRSETFRVFAGVGRSLGLGWSEIWMLQRVARMEKLTTPLTLLICESTLMHHVESAAGRLKERRKKPLRRRAARVADQLFS